MRRSSKTPHLLCLLAAIFAIDCLNGFVTAQEQNNRKPNIIFILADDLGYAELGAYGQKKIKTPRLDQLAAEGMKLTNFYSGSPVCAPSRATFITGQHTGHTFVRDNKEFGGFGDHEEHGQMPLRPNDPSVARWLQSKGYQTAIVGKWGLGGPETTGVPNKQGFDFFYGFLDQKQAHNYYPTHLWRNDKSEKLNNEYFSPHQKHTGDAQDPSSYNKYKGKDYAIDLMTSEALGYIRENREKAFFLFFAPTLPHLALQVPDEELMQYSGKFPDTAYTNSDGRGYLPHQMPRAAYAAMISYFDKQVGKIMDELKRLGIEENTLLIVTSDNGASYVREVDYKFFDSFGGLRGYKEDLYEGGIRVPFIASWKGKIPAGKASGLPGASWDLWATFADMIRQKPPSGIDGVSIMPTLVGKGKQLKRDSLYWEFPGKGGQQAVRIGKWKGIRTRISRNPDAPIELYNLDKDPGETKNVAGENARVVKRIARIMRASHVPSQEFPIKGLDDQKK